MSSLDSNGKYLVYLRKSRQDREQETLTGNIDTLKRHRDTLLKLAAGMGLSIVRIYEEVVSGDTIAERPEMQKLLSDVETGQYAGVLVMEVPRLARGNTRDQGIVAETFQYSGTKIITPNKIYDPSNDADEEYFEFGLFMSRREYKMINRRLQRGRVASLDEGKYIAGSAPYGYEKYKLPGQKGYSLRTVPEKAQVVARIYNEFVNTNKGSYTIANELNSEGVPAPGGSRWTAIAVRDIIKNPTYAGYLRWSYRPVTKYMENGERYISTPINKEPKIVKGIHEAIISTELYEKSNAILSSRSHPPVPGGKRITNPLAGLVFCSNCGRSLVQNPSSSKHGPALFCPTPHCPTMSSHTDVVEAAILSSLRQWIKDYELELPNSSNELEPLLKGAQQDVSVQTALISKLNTQKSRLFDLLEQGVYSQEIFIERSKILSERLETANTALKNAEIKLNEISIAAEARNGILPKIRQVISDYYTLTDPASKNSLLKSVLKKAVYYKTQGGRWEESNMKVFIFPNVPKDFL